MTEFEERLLGDVLTLKRGYDLPSRLREPGTVPIVSSSGITGAHSTAKVEGPGVVTGRYGTLGEVFYVDEPFWPLNTTLYVRDFKDANPRFAAYYLKGMGLGRYDGASAVPGLDRNVLHRVPVKWPSRSLQDRIAALLAAYDVLIDNNARRIAILEEMTAALFREWFINYRIPGSHGEEFLESGIGPIPAGWTATTVGESIRLNPRQRLSKDVTYRFVPMPSLVPWSMLVDGVKERVGPSGAQFMNGDTLLARINPSLQNGKTSFVQFLEQSEVACGSTEFIVMRSLTLTPEFVYLLARTDDLRRTAINSMVGASGRQRVQEPALTSYRFAHPPQALLDRFTEVARPAFALVQTLADRNANLKATRDFLLPRLVEGGINVAELDIATEWLAV